MSCRIIGLLVFSFLFGFGCRSVDERGSTLTDKDLYVDKPWWPVVKSSDVSLSSSHSLYKYFRAARDKRLPTNYFRDLIRAKASVSIKKSDWPSYKPGIFYGGTIKHPASGREPSQWSRMDWQSFYNELFHAWWGLVFMKDSKYKSDRAKLFTRANDAKYKKAYPRNPRLAQEEAYSETIATLTIYFYPIYNPDGPHRYSAFEKFAYNTRITVASVSHSDRPGYQPIAETTYPSPYEYSIIFKQFTDLAPPQ